ncbi:MAG TPA: hypothetical protein DF614_04215 [Methylococcaceae bacterium]|nr:hypothetical protein [Methylococcaceae bacterium]
MKLNAKDIETGFLYQTSDKHYRAVLAVKGDFLIYVASLGAVTLNLANPQEIMPFDNQPFKKCQIATFAKKDYQLFSANATQENIAIKHALNDKQLADITLQCNAKAAIATL